MTCSGRYAEAWEFASFFCNTSLLSRTHDGSNDAAVLSDSQANFQSNGVRANVGMVLYNLTDGSSGVVTALTQTTLTATLAGGVGNDWDTGDIYRIVTIDTEEIARANQYLDITAADVHAALAAQDACDCSLSDWGLGLLKKLNIIDAASFYTCSCMVSLSTEERAALREWMTAQLELIRMGKVDVCSGATGSEYPYLGIAEIAYTRFSAAQIIANRIARNGL